MHLRKGDIWIITYEKILSIYFLLIFLVFVDKKYFFIYNTKLQAIGLIRKAV